MAMENLSIAQHRDTLWYAHTRGGSYKLKVRQFDVGDFVCQRTNDANQMLFCDTCNGGYHLFCLKPEFIQVPADIWYYSSCSLVTP
ncbi:hypothetical protein BDL97_06G012200 [Sphagnum fallax]|nr:hypothetical protein BDL97_06G012200 [Sphagnum fallax]